MNKLFFILGRDNVENWEENEIEEINLNNVYSVNFKTPQEKQSYINALSLIAREVCGYECYHLLDEDEYKFLTTFVSFLC